MNFAFNIQKCIIYVLYFHYFLILGLLPSFSSSFCLFDSTSDSEHKVTIKSTGPVTLDTPIWFTAELYPYEKGTYTYEWEDDSWPRNRFKDKDQGPISKWSLIYNSSAYELHTGHHRVTVKVYKPYCFDNVAEDSLSFQVSDNLNGELSITQPNVTMLNPGYISTLNVTNITAIIHDPNDWMKNRTERISFYWYINDRDTKNVTPMGPCSTPSLIINITKPGNYFIQSTILLTLSDQPITTTTSTTTTTTTTTTTPAPHPPNTTTVTTTLAPHNKTTTSMPPTPPTPDPVNYLCDGYWNGYEESQIFSRSFTKYGLFYTEVAAREPMRNFNVSGTTWLRHGALLNLKVKCAGSGPFYYCYNITYGSFNDSDPKICEDQSVITSVCGFSIQRYLAHSGTYTVVIKMYNDVSEKLVRMAINVYNVDRKPQLLHIIIPVSCSLVAIIIVIFGIAHFIQSKQRYSVEVADFDFCASEETEYKTFIQQLKEALRGAFSADINTTAHQGRRHTRSRVERPRILEDDD